MMLARLRARAVRWSMRGTGAARGRTERASVLVEATLESGAIGLGEAAPLPGMSRADDTIEAVLAAIERLSARLPLPIDALEPALPSLAFALETAVSSAIAAARGVSLADALGLMAPATEVSLAAVVDDESDARRAVARGITTLKIKVGADVATEVERVARIADEVPGATLRLDANRGWRIQDVAKNLARFAALPIEYVEEPCRDTRLLLGEDVPLKLALDESLATMAPDEIEAALCAPALGAVICKPTLLGGLSACMFFAARAHGTGVRAVVSHALEGPIGTAACAELARAFAAFAGDEAVGLAPHPALDGWRLAVPQLAAATVRAAELPGLGFGALDLDAALAAAP